MNDEIIFNFKTDISGTNIPENLNNPFSTYIPEIARVAAQEFQDFISLNSKEWEHDFKVQKGKMFGILVIQKVTGDFGYLGTISGKLSGNKTCNQFTPSVFDDSVDDFFINRGMTELTTISNQIKNTTEIEEIAELKATRKSKSLALQNRLFENYLFLNQLGDVKNALQVFKDSAHGYPPAAAGECAAPKLLQYAFKHKLRPIAIAEFWWGNTPKSNERNHREFYVACKDKCRPILEFMLDDSTLFDQGYTTTI